ncbi:macro domain-containing protein [Chondromyces crocatus]|uniref:Macro domain-containing protein n=1 Tax=Chondromyces crocatus TaxID=52 RepID=A0A0K1EF97_CHOCO|nr:macro domain-containing protein [Chondromyces crocatus]AKT39367.1 uncharacterized protein CMC5_035140 [Chondromyces crocatus]
MSGSQPSDAQVEVTVPESDAEEGQAAVPERDAAEGQVAPMGSAWVGRLHLVDSDEAVVTAWRHHFAVFPEVEVVHGDIVEVAAHAVVSPANGYGFMDGGVDRAYVRFFGASIEERVRAAIRCRPEGVLSVGAALVVDTGHPRIPRLIVAPTVLMPEPVPASHAYRALRAVLRVVTAWPASAGDVYCPGLTTGVGGVAPDEAAREMALAFRDWCAVHRGTGPSGG